MIGNFIADGQKGVVQLAIKPCRFNDLHLYHAHQRFPQTRIIQNTFRCNFTDVFAGGFWLLGEIQNHTSVNMGRNAQRMFPNPAKRQNADMIIIIIARVNVIEHARIFKQIVVTKHYPFG